MSRIKFRGSRSRLQMVEMFFWMGDGYSQYIDSSQFKSIIRVFMEERVL
jgi:hypothetical protein